MKRILLLIIFSAIVTFATGQTVIVLSTADTSKIVRTNGTGKAELILRNGDKSVANGIAYNAGNGWMRYATVGNGLSFASNAFKIDTSIIRTVLNSFSKAAADARFAPISGGVYVSSVSGTTNRITSTGGTTPVIDISASYVGQSSLTTLGTITTGVWTAGAVTAPTVTIGANGLGSTTNRISQVSATNDLFAQYATGTVADQGEYVFEAGDNGTPWSADGQRWRFWYNATSSGVSKNAFIIDYDVSTFATNLALGTNNLTLTGSIGATGARVTKGWLTDVESTNMYTVGGVSLSSTFAPINSGVTSITGTANQVIASASTGAVTLSLPQSIATSSTPQFARFGVGAAPLAGNNIYNAADITGGTSAYANTTFASVQSDVTIYAIGYLSSLRTQAAAFTLPTLSHFEAFQSTIGAGSTVTTQYGFKAGNTLIGATNNYGFYGDIASGTNRWNLYMGGTAVNYINGNLQLGSTTATAGTEKLQVTGTASISSTLLLGGALTGTTATFTNNINGDAPFYNINTSSGTGAFSTIYASNDGTGAGALSLGAVGTGNTAGGIFVQDGGIIASGTNLSGGLSIATRTSSAIRLYTDNILALTLASNQAATFTGAGTFGGIISSTLTSGNVIQHVSGGTNNLRFRLSNDGITGYFAIDNSAGTDFGGAAYALNIMGVGARPLQIGTNTTIRYIIDSGGDNTWTGAGVFGGTLGINGTANNVKGDTYTPTITNGTNVTAHTAYVTNYTRVGNIVTVGGRVNATATSSGVTSHILISLPVASNFANSEDAGGSGTGGNLPAEIRADAASDTVKLEWFPNSAGSNWNFYFTFTYRII